MTPQPLDPFEFDTLEVDPPTSPTSRVTTSPTSRATLPLTGDIKMATKTPAAGSLPLSSDRPRLSAHATVGEFTSLEQVEGQELLLHSFEEITTKFGTAYKTGATDLGGQVHVLCLGQMVVKEAIQNLLEASGGEPDFPIAVKFVRPGRAWVME